MAAPLSPWRRDLLPSSFRGIRFEVESRDLSGGRNAVTHEYPDAEEVYTEDLGRKADHWSVDGYVWGPDTMTRRDALKKALREPGAGEYVDHWGGRHWVVVRAWTCREEIAKGGWATFRLDLVEAGVVKAQVIRGDSRTLVSSHADDAAAGIAGDFDAAFSLDGPAFVAETVLVRLDQVGGRMSGLAATVGSVGMGPLGRFQRSLSAFRGGLAALVNTPSALSSRLQSLVGQLVGLGGGRAAYQMAGGLYSVGSDWPVVAPLTPNRVRQAANQSAIIALVARTALVEQARVAAGLDYPDMGEAVMVRGELSERIDAQTRMSVAGAAPSIATRQALRRLQGAVTRDITVRGADLSRLATITPQATQPALVVAHRLYGDATRAAEIMARNPDLGHPLFVPGGHALKVAADG